MGIFWKFTMPLLSTLAALVILVHSAEDNTSSELNQYELRPSGSFNTKSPMNNEPWRIGEVDPVMQEVAWDIAPPIEQPIRRRLGRKRKRRPPSEHLEYSRDETEGTTHSEEQETVRHEEQHKIPLQHRYMAQIESDTTLNDQQDNFNEQETTETPKRQRNKLKIRPNRWNDEPIDSEAPLRRRLHRRKRPSLDTWPQLSEFAMYRDDDNDEFTPSNKQTTDRTSVRNQDTGLYQPQQKTIQRYEDFIRGESRHSSRPTPNSRFVLAQKEFREITPLMKEDKSLSEFSIEVLSPNSPPEKDEEVDKKKKLKDKPPQIFYEIDKSREKTLLLDLDKYFDFKSDYISFPMTKDQKRKNISEKKEPSFLKSIMQEVKSYNKVGDPLGVRKVYADSAEENENPIKTKEKIHNRDYYYHKRKVTHKAPKNYLEEFIREHEPIDPLTLKDILKRSNGTSLSEILQQHNLSLADLLNGKANAISVLKSQKTLEAQEHLGNNIVSKNTNNDEFVQVILSKENDQTILEDKIGDRTTKTLGSELLNTKNKNVSINTDEQSSELFKIHPGPISEEDEPTIKNKTANYTGPTKTLKEVANIHVITSDDKPSRMLSKRRFPGGIRRKLRMRPMVNSTYKSQLNRDLIALSARRYINHNRRNSTKAKEWREMIHLMPNINVTENLKKQENSSLITTSIPEEITTSINMEESSSYTIGDDALTTVSDLVNETETVATEVTEPTTISIEILATEIDFNVTEKPIVAPTLRQAVNASGLRRQAYNNRLKKKRLKHKTASTEASHDTIIKNILNMGDFVSSSEFIARTQYPKAFNPDFKESVTELEDFMTTEASSRTNDDFKSTKYTPVSITTKMSTVTKMPFTISTEETAKIEIDEILNDTRTSAKLSKILKERNMTLNELLEHRERGSSHVHLADIFHNASREPNPPEPFLSKSLIEPISKETYPLRALLDANLHDPTAKATTRDPNLLTENHISIPVIMDFGNNVNENAENMGIMSLFDNLTKGAESNEKEPIQKDSKGIPYKSSVISVNSSDDNDMARESRMLNDDQDMASWNEIFAMIRNNQNNKTKEFDVFTQVSSVSESPYKKTSLEEDLDGDGLIVFEDLQHLKDFDNLGSDSNEKINFNSYEQVDLKQEHGILNKTPSSTKSVTVATASIVGLAMILFLLTYAILKWKQQRSLNHKNTFCNERIPSPVFENRKVKKNCSSRSISPMLPTSNIYTMSTLDSQTGKDSPEYMWDSLRKPFQ